MKKKFFKLSLLGILISSGITIFAFRNVNADINHAPHFSENLHFNNETKQTHYSKAMKRTAETITLNLEASLIRWEIAPGKIIEGYGYNNQIPGPVVRAHKGDTLIVHLKNNIDQPTTIHWHGLRIPSVMDGTEEVQPAVQPGETFTYKFILPDAGTYWYHPHSNETVQMEKGLYGAIIVEDEHDPITDNDRLFLIDDMKLTNGNNFKQPGWFFPRWMERHDGREGETLLVNGKEQAVIHTNAGQIERWRFINTSSARYFHLFLEGRPFLLIGTDGGLLENPIEKTELLITPGERMDIIAGPFDEGEVIRLQSLPYDRGTKGSKLQDFATIETGKPKTSHASIPANFQPIKPLIGKDASVTRHIKLHGRRNWKDGVDFTINDEMHLYDEPVKSGELQVWEVTNPSMLDHPFHLHGFFFQVLEVNGEAPEYQAWKDTFNVPRGGKIKIAWMPDDRIGKWMYHCHILEHAAAGMMAHFEVIGSGETASDTVHSVRHSHHK